MLCAECHFENSGTAKFCMECGHRLAEDTPPPLSLQPTAEGGPAQTDPVDAALSLQPTIPPAGAQDTPDSTGQLVAARYELLRPLGQGGMGAVHLARDTKPGMGDREVAIKRILDADDQGVQRFLRESATIAALNHQNIRAVFDRGEDDQGHYLVMEYVEGETLHDRVARDGPLDDDTFLELARGLAKALAFAHRKKVTHRDVKPANVLFAADGTPKLTDFGLARMGHDSDLSMTGYGMGTLDYASPGQRRDAKSADHRSDIYGLGATLYFAITGELPRTIRESRIPTEYRPTLLRCLEERSEDRYFSVDDFLYDWRAADQSGPQRRADSGPAAATCHSCPECQVTNPEDRRFCSSCGADLFQACQNCERPERAGVRFCGACGLDLPAGLEADRLLGEARQLLQAGRFEEALALAEQASAACSSREDVAAVLSKAQAQFDFIRAARDTALEAEGRGDLEEAATQWRRLLEVLPDHDEARQALESLPARRETLAVAKARREVEKSVRSGQATMVWDHLSSLSVLDSALAAEMRPEVEELAAKERERLTKKFDQHLEAGRWGLAEETLSRITTVLGPLASEVRHSLKNEVGGGQEAKAKPVEPAHGHLPARPADRLGLAGPCPDQARLVWKGMTEGGCSLSQHVLPPGVRIPGIRSLSTRLTWHDVCPAPSVIPAPRIMRSIVLPLLLAGCVSAPLGSDFEHARDLAARGHFDAACDFAEPLLAEAPVSDELREACGWALQADRLQDALHWGTVLLRQEPGDLDGHAARGIALLELGRPADALADLESAHRAGPARPRVQRGLGMALFQVEREPGRAQALLVLSGAQDGAAAQALRKLDADLHPEPGPEAWTQAAALSRSAVCLVLERELGLSEFLARYQAEPGLSGDPGRRQDRQDEADRLIDLPADEAEARILARFVSVGLVAPDSRRFRPDQGMERGAFAWIVAELDRQVGAGADPDLGSTDDTSSFSDLSARHSDYRAARLATTLGAMRADGARRFRPSAPLSGADLEQALEPLRAVLGRSTFFAGPGGESGAVQAERVEPAAPAQQTAPEQEPAAEATAAPQGYLGEAVGRDRATATAAARQDAMARAITELHREEGLAAPLDAAARRLAELQDSLGGFLTTTTLEESWDDRTSLARVRLAVAADRAAFRREAARALRLDVQATGILSEALAARFRDRFATAGFEVVLSSAREAADARVEVSGRAEELPGGEAGFKAWRPGLAVRVLTHSHRDAARVVLLDQVFGSEDGKALYGTDATETVRQPVLAWAAEAADLAATRILDGVVSGARRTLVVQGATQRSLVADLLAAIERQGAAAGVLGTSELSFEAPYAEFQLALDRRGATRLGEILTTLQLSEGRRVRVVREAGATLLVRIEAR